MLLMNVESAAVQVSVGRWENVIVNKESSIASVIAVVENVKITAVSVVEMVLKKVNVIVTVTL